MWEPRRLTILRVFTACYRDSFTLYLVVDSFTVPARSHILWFVKDVNEKTVVVTIINNTSKSYIKFFLSLKVPISFKKDNVLEEHTLHIFIPLHFIPEKSVSLPVEMELHRKLDGLKENINTANTWEYGQINGLLIQRLQAKMNYFHAFHKSVH
jgi:hypothetical protein